MALDDWLKTAGVNRDLPPSVQGAATQVSQFAAQQAEAIRRAQAAQQQAQQVMDQQNLSALQTRLVELTAQEQEEMSAPRAIHNGGVGSEPIPVQHHRCEVLVALLPVGGADIIPAARHLLAVSPELQSDPGFLERARESDRYFTELVQRYGAILRRLNDRMWWLSVMTAAGRANSVTTQEQWQGNYGAGVRDVVTTTAPAILGVRVADTGLRVRVAGLPGDTLEDWESSLDQLRDAFHSACVPAARLAVRQDAQGNFILDVNDAVDGAAAQTIVVESPGVETGPREG